MWTLGSVYGLEISAQRSVIPWAIALWIVLALVAYFLLGLSFAEAVIGGLVGVGLHFLSEFLHQLGHAGAARRTGYPMKGVRFYFLLGASLYPKEEPPLPGKIHIRRALGGPAVSLVVSIVALLILLVAQNVGGLVFGLAVWFLLDNLFVFTLGALLPLGFTDGSTILVT